MRTVLGVALLGLLMGIVECQVEIGSFPAGSAHQVSGTVFVLSDTMIQIKNFKYDGQGPDAFFYVGKKGVSGSTPDSKGIIVPDEMGSKNVLMAYNNVDITLTLESGSVKDLLWLSIWCRRFTVNFGHVSFPASLTPPSGTPPPSPMYYGETIGPLANPQHGVSGEVYVVDENRIRVTGFSYDGTGPDAYFYIGKKGQHGSVAQAGGIIVPNELGSSEKLVVYSNKDVVLTLPSGTTATQIAWFSIWCLQVGVDFGSVVFPTSGLSVPATFNLGPFSQLGSGVSSGDVEILDKKTIKINQLNYDGKGPDVFFFVGVGGPSKQGTKVPDENGSFDNLKKYEAATITLTLPGGITVDDIDYLSLYCYSYAEDFGHVTLPSGSYMVPPYIPPPPMIPLVNCKAMNKDFNVAWEIDGTNITFEFTGALDGDDGYMAFGISGSTSSSAMDGSDPMVAFLDNASPRVADYTINSKSYCSGTTGVCPDTDQTDGQDNLSLIRAKYNNGVTTVRFSRSLAAAEAFDKGILASGSQFVVWAMGNVNAAKIVTKHTSRSTGNLEIDFSQAVQSCEEIKGKDQVEIKSWKAKKISGMDTKKFTARLGPTGGKKGYAGITGSISWGIAWYINGYLIPEITVRRGDTFTFEVEGGNDPTFNAKYHPLYITDDPVGGYAAKTDKTNIKLFAGTTTNENGTFGTDGRFCEYTTTANGEDHNTFESFKSTLKLECDDDGEAGTFTWTPDSNTPDTVYYQCFTHSYLGWKIRVTDDYPPVSGSEGLMNRNGRHFGVSVMASLLVTMFIGAWF